jgi:hypothetical protein
MPLSKRVTTATTVEPRRTGPDPERFAGLLKTWSRATKDIRDHLVVERGLGGLELVDEILHRIEDALSPMPCGQDWNIAVDRLSELAEAVGFNDLHTAELTHALGGVEPEDVLRIREENASAKPSGASSPPKNGR